MPERRPFDAAPISASDRAAWSDVVAHSADAWLGHDWDWNLLIEEGVWRSPSFSLIVRQGDRAVGVLPLHLTIRRIGPFARRVLFSNRWGYGGIALSDDLTSEERRSAMTAAMAGAHDAARRARADKLIFKLPSLSWRALRRLDAANPLVALGMTDGSSVNLILPIAGRTEDQLWMGMEGRARTAIRKAERAAIRVYQPDPEAAIDAYYQLHLETYERSGARPHPREFFETVFRSPWANVFFAERGSKLVAALNVGLYGGRAIYWTSASRTEGAGLGANNLLQWYAIRWLLARSVAAYELGELPTGQRTFAEPSKLDGIARYKAGFGGEAIPYYRGVYVYARLREAVVSRLGAALRRIGT